MMSVSGHHWDIVIIGNKLKGKLHIFADRQWRLSHVSSQVASGLCSSRRALRAWPQINNFYWWSVLSSSVLTFVGRLYWCCSIFHSCSTITATITHDCMSAAAGATNSPRRHFSVKSLWLNHNCGCLVPITVLSPHTLIRQRREQLFLPALLQ